MTGQLPFNAQNCHLIVFFFILDKSKFMLSFGA